MPLNTSITRNGELLKLPNGWGGFHIAAMVIAASIDSGEGPFTGMRKGRVNQNYRVIMGQDYPGDFHTCDNMEQVPNRPEICRNCGHVMPIIVSPRDTFQLMSYPVISMTPLNRGAYTLKHDYEFIDAKDSEILQLLAGDELHAFRD